MMKIKMTPAPVIFIVEDESIVANDIKDTLISLGYGVAGMAKYAENAIEKIAETQPDLVLMDIQLIGPMDGIEAAGLIHTKYGIPVIFLTAYANDTLFERAKVTEPYGYILKPYDERVLHSTIEMALYKHTMQRRLKESEDALRKVSRKLAVLSSITRDNINNQLTILMGFLHILEKKQPAPSLSEYFQKASTAAQCISEMIQFSNEYEKIGIEAPLWYDTHKLVSLAAKQAPLGQIEVKINLRAGMEVFADPLVAKVFYNLMDNAVRYGGKITTIRFSVQESVDEQVLVCEDDGDGVPADVKEKIFDRGFGKNTGLGLFLSREILSITGITIKETGKPGKGARFEMTVPNGAWRKTQSYIKGE